MVCGLHVSTCTQQNAEVGDMRNPPVFSLSEAQQIGVRSVVATILVTSEEFSAYFEKKRVHYGRGLRYERVETGCH